MRYTFFPSQLSRVVQRPGRNKVKPTYSHNSKPTNTRKDNLDKRPFWKKPKKDTSDRKRKYREREHRIDDDEDEAPKQKKFRKESRNRPEKKGESPEILNKILTLTLAPNFISACQNNCFSADVKTMVESAGLSLSDIIVTATKPIAGRLQSRLHFWKQITDNHWALSVVGNGLRFDWKAGVPTPHRTGNPPLDLAAKLILDEEVAAMLEKGAIHEVVSCKDEVVSAFFARPKKTPGKWRPICSLLHTNRFIRKISFRMTTTKMLKSWIMKDHFFVSIYLQDAYFSIPLAENVRRFCRFTWRGKLYEYLCMMFGIGPSARVFTKLLKVVLAFLRRSFSTKIAGYIDDFLIMGATIAECLLQTQITILVLQTLGFSVNFEKSMLTPSKSVEHLGFIWNSETMTVSLPNKKITGISTLAGQALHDCVISVHSLRSLLGRLESVRLVTEQGPLHYRSLQKLIPTQEPHKSRRLLRLTTPAMRDLLWWRDSFPTPTHTSAPLRKLPITKSLMSDALGEYGWGGHSNTDFVQGEWTNKELLEHINVKELRAAHSTIDTFMERGDHVHISMDSTCAVAYLNKMGGTRSRALCQVAINIWDTVLSRDGWVTASWVPREENEASDLLSKSPLQTWEFGLQPEIAAQLWDTYFTPDIDLFASNAFHLLTPYCSWFPDREAATGDAFSLPRWPTRAYAFPPVPLIRKTLEKAEQDGTLLILVVPDWRLGLWWDTLEHMLVTSPVDLGWYRDILHCNPGHKLPHLGRLLGCLVASSTASPYSVARL